jgi:hypothetical protein
MPAALTLALALSVGQPAHQTAKEFLAPYEPAEFAPIFVDALDTFLEVEALVRAEDYRAASDVMEVFWAKYPPGSEAWPGGLIKPAGLNIGSPPCYYALRMLTDLVKLHVAGDVEPPSERPAATLTVALVGQAEGIQPTSRDELERGVGVETRSRIDERLLADDSALLHEALWLFGEYVLALTDGRMGMETRVLHLPETTVPVRVEGVFAGLAPGAWEAIWSAVPREVQDSTDWWWVLYPSHVPEQYPDFTETEFITGGMGRGPGGASPCFISDDRWVLRKPPHLGYGDMTSVERRAYLPQWLQHEFFHHVYQRYPSFGLEAEGHQWFDRSIWPDDFDGRFEPDYYHESLYKRVLPFGDPPPHVQFRYNAPPPELYAELELSDVIGRYRHEPVQNPWHEGEITLEADGETLRWTNEAGVSWTLTPELDAGALHTSEANPYYGDSPGSRMFRVLLRRDATGDHTGEILGFAFGGGVYEKVGGG